MKQTTTPTEQDYSRDLVKMLADTEAAIDFLEATAGLVVPDEAYDLRAALRRAVDAEEKLARLQEKAAT